MKISTRPTTTSNIDARITYPMFGDILPSDWCDWRLNQALDAGLIKSWNYVDQKECGGIIDITFDVTFVLEYPISDAPDEQDEVISITMDPLVAKIVRDSDARIISVRTF